MAHGDVEIGKRLRLARQAVRMSRLQLADAIGIEPLTLAQVEAGTRAMSIVQLIRAAEFVDVDMPYFFEKTRQYVVAAPRDNVVAINADSSGSSTKRLGRSRRTNGRPVGLL